MTRINIIPAEMLTDEHLRGEYKEITRVFSLSRAHFESTGQMRPKDAPERYKLGKGHVKFFYDKLLWLAQRYRKLYELMKARGYNPDDELFESISEQAAKFIMDNYESLEWPQFSPEEYYANMARIVRRSNNAEIQALLGEK